ncbi:FAD:protein FMN transferase [Candidatus Erwinia haradaeae]|uniref:FAD:protein FMN transferase n=1 Tax=Candidatus Erwinia haradaeae TaxID=1922217 RepID=A0A451D8X5_9GAMM|nr:FAD:protein FMN transferase [Candidatus Erwinia haradaeae]VFP82299.1 FAD:protein FMN transferase [Candidatus Erwinia haradaeae]
MNNAYRYFVFYILIFMQSSCSYPHPLLNYKTTILTGHSMGTIWRVNVVDIQAERKHALHTSIQKILDYDDAQLSTWKTDSVLSRFNQYKGYHSQPVSTEIADIITQALRVGNQMNGAMDITIGSLVNLWGFGPRGSLKFTPTQRQIDCARSLHGLSYLTVTNSSTQSYLRKDMPGIYIDLSSVGEGYAVDHLVHLMQKEGIDNYLVSVGGAIVTCGHNAQGKPWKIAIQKPIDQENAVQDIVELKGCGISTSGTYRNYYELNGKPISHLINPFTGQPAQNELVSATVIAPTALEADCWDSGLMILGLKKSQELAIKHKKAVYLVYKKNDQLISWISPKFFPFIQSPSLGNS